MSLQVKLALEGNLEKFTKDVTDKVAFASLYATETYGRKLQLALRDDARSGGLGEGVANAWRLNIYKDNPSQPAALVYSKAPMIVTAFSKDTTIVAKDGHSWLAIPTDNVPRLGNHHMSPEDVERSFSQKLIFLTTRPGTALAFVNAVPSANAKGFRAPTAKRLAQGRARQLVLMFVMVQQVHLRKRLDWPTLMANARDDFEKFFGGVIAEQLGD